MMRRLAANLTFLFAELPFLERFAAAKQAGFSGVEMLFPFAYAPEAITEQLKLHNLTLVLHNTPAPDWDAGDRGLAALPGQETAFRHEFARCLRYAEQLQPEHIHIMAGLSAGPDARRTFIKNLRWAAWAKCRLRVRHIQIAGYPGRHEPVGGDIDYPAFLAGLDEGGYRGWVSAEYFPGQHSTVAGLGWMTGA
jgi:hydroxypyruvate isomerase